MTDTRRTELTRWAQQEIATRLSIASPNLKLLVVSGDASFRRYFRAEVKGESFILVDAPPEKEDCHPFVSVAALFKDAGMTTPEVLSVNYGKGFMLLEDFGDNLYLSALKKELSSNQDVGYSGQVEWLYHQAINALVDLQSNADIAELEPYDKKLLHREMMLFETWFCKEFLHMELNDADRRIIAAAFSLLEEEVLEQPIVAVHRDYHSRNLMVLDQKKFAADRTPGVIDFQDAVAGPYTYDLVSLLRDCYVQWNPERVRHWAITYLNQARIANVIPALEEDKFLRDFDLMGLQRHLKVMGIFSRLCIRDNKPQFLADIPMVIDYFLDVIEHYHELAEFRQWFNDKVLPLAVKKLPVGSLCEQ